MGSPNEGMFTSTTDEWPTPQDLFDALDAEFGFQLDPCASVDNAKCARYYTRDDDGLSQPWQTVAFMNPPYGRAISEWVAKAWRESAHATVVCLLPARTDTAWWHDYVMRAEEVRLIRGRLSFASAIQDERKAATGAHNAPFPSAVIVFQPGHQGPPRLSAVNRDGSAVVTPLEVIAGDRVLECRWAGCRNAAFIEDQEGSLICRKCAGLDGTAA